MLKKLILAIAFALSLATTTTTEAQDAAMDPVAIKFIEEAEAAEQWCRDRHVDELREDVIFLCLRNKTRPIWNKIWTHISTRSLVPAKELNKEKQENWMKTIKYLRKVAGDIAEENLTARAYAACGRACDIPSAAPYARELDDRLREMREELEETQRKRAEVLRENEELLLRQREVQALETIARESRNNNYRVGWESWRSGR